MHKKSCERDGKFAEAEMTKRKLWSLRKQADLKERFELQTNYVRLVLSPRTKKKGS